MATVLSKLAAPAMADPLVEQIEETAEPQTMDQWRDAATATIVAAVGADAGIPSGSQKIRVQIDAEGKITDARTLAPVENTEMATQVVHLINQSAPCQAARSKGHVDLYSTSLFIFHEEDLLIGRQRLLLADGSHSAFKPERRKAGTVGANH